MKTLKPLKALLATSALILTAGAVYAQPVHFSGTFSTTTYDSGTHAWSCSPTGSSPSIATDSIVTVDQDYSTPSDSLSYLFGVQIVLPSGGYSCSDGTNSTVLGTTAQGSWTTDLHSVDENFTNGIDAIAPTSVVGDLSTGFTVTYDWGDATCTTTDTAGDFAGSHSGTVSNPDWDWAQLIVVIDETFAPQTVTLKTRECLSGYADTVYVLTPLP